MPLLPGVVHVTGSQGAPVKIVDQVAGFLNVS